MIAITILAIVSIFAITGSLLYVLEMVVKTGRENFREYAKATMAKDLKEYTEVIPEEKEEENKEEEHVFEDLDNMDPEELLRVLGR